MICKRVFEPKTENTCEKPLAVQLAAVNEIDRRNFATRGSVCNDLLGALPNTPILDRINKIIKI